MYANRIMIHDFRLELTEFLGYNCGSKIIVHEITLQLTKFPVQECGS